MAIKVLCDRITQVNASSRNAMPTMNLENCPKRQQKPYGPPCENLRNLKLMKLILHLFPTLGIEIGMCV